MDAFMTRTLPNLTAKLVNNLEPQGIDPKTHITPNHYGGAKKSKDREQWEKAMDEELTNCRYGHVRNRRANQTIRQGEVPIL